MTSDERREMLHELAKIVGELVIKLPPGTDALKRLYRLMDKLREAGERNALDNSVTNPDT